MHSLTVPDDAAGGRLDRFLAVAGGGRIACRRRAPDRDRRGHGGRPVPAQVAQAGGRPDGRLPGARAGHVGAGAAGRWTSRCSTATTTCWWSTSRPGCSCTRCRATAGRPWCTACCTRSAARACGPGSCTGSIATRPACWWWRATTAPWRGCSRSCAGGASTAATRRWCAAARRRGAAPSRRRSAATGAIRPASRSTRTWPSRPSRTSRSPSCARAARCWTWSSRPAAPTRSACTWPRSAARWWATASTGTAPSSASSASSCTPRGCGSRIPGAASRSMSPRRCRPTWRPRWSWRGGGAVRAESGFR